MLANVSPKTSRMSELLVGSIIANTMIRSPLAPVDDATIMGISDGTANVCKWVGS